jgi:hypothetical protein
MRLEIPALIGWLELEISGPQTLKSLNYPTLRSGLLEAFNPLLPRKPPALRLASLAKLSSQHADSKHIDGERIRDLEASGCGDLALSQRLRRQVMLIHDTLPTHNTALRAVVRFTCSRSVPPIRRNTC